MDAFDLFARLRLSTDDFENALDKSNKKAALFAKGLDVAFSAVTSALKSVAKGIIDLTQDAVESYANYEQLVGGVETLFGAQGMSVEEYAESVGKTVDEVSDKFGQLEQAQSIVMENAANAFKTAGMSANDYMETVTGFAAALTSSLGGDTVKAAQVADMAITDMADNANKMGTSMESIQNAYAGFSKQNYTMLDNLKLGYGGTKEEMQRLLDKAEELSGMTFDIGNYSDIVNAIHVVQDELGITGTTAREAASTISGSLASLQAAWQNLVTGIADENADFDGLIENVVTSAETALHNVLPRIETALGGISSLIQGILPTIAAELPGIITSIFPQIADAAFGIMDALATGLMDNADVMLNMAVETIEMLVGKLSDASGEIIPAAVSIIVTLADALVGAIPNLIPVAVDIVINLANSLIQNLNKVIVAAGEIITSIIQGILYALPSLLEQAPMLIFELNSALNEAIVTILKTGGDIINTIANTLVHFDWGEIARTMLTNLVNNLSEKFGIVAGWIDETFGTDFSSTVSRITEMAQNGVEAVSGFVDYVATDVADRYDRGISTLESEYGITLFGASEEMAKNTEDAMETVTDSVSTSSEKVNTAIIASGNNAADATKKSTAKQESALKKHMTMLETSFKAREITEAEYYAKRLEYLEEHKNAEDEEWSKYYDQTMKWYDKLEKEEQKQIDKQIKEAQKNYQKLQDERKKEFDELIKTVDKYSDKLAGKYADMYTFKTDSEGNIVSATTTNKMKEQQKDLNAYLDDLQSLIDRGVSSDMLDQLTEMSQDEAAAVADYWASLSDTELSNLESNWKEVNRISEKISELLYDDESAELEKKYQDKGKALADSLKNGFDSEITENGGLLSTLSTSDYITPSASATSNNTGNGQNAAQGIVGGSTGVSGITININGIQYQSFDDLAKAISEELQSMTNRKAVSYA